MRAAIEADDAGSEVLVVSKSRRGDPHTVLALFERFFNLGRPRGARKFTCKGSKMATSKEAKSLGMSWEKEHLCGYF